jgi:hypothetical protein
MQVACGRWHDAVGMTTCLRVVLAAGYSPSIAHSYTGYRGLSLASFPHVNTLLSTKLAAICLFGCVQVRALAGTDR